MHRYSRPLLILAVALVAVLAIGAFVPPDVIQLVTGGEGLSLHVVGVGLVTFLIVLALPRLWAVSSLAMIAAIGAAELVQPIFGRGAQWSDVWAGLFGLVAGAASAGAVLAAIRRMRDDG